MKNFLIVLLGPTGVGKTDVSIDIARHFRCEIISADSRQFFREMKIGTAVPDETQLTDNQTSFYQIYFNRRLLQLKSFRKRCSEASSATIFRK